MEVKAIQGDIAEQRADVLVNAAGTSLKMGSGVAGSLKKKAGKEINQEAVSKGPIDLGEVEVTDAYNLDAKCVIHAAAMPHYGDGKATRESIKKATYNSLKKADELGYKSIVMPMLGCGIAGFDLEKGAEIIINEIKNYTPKNLSIIKLIGYTQNEYNIIKKKAEKIK